MKTSGASSKLRVSVDDSAAFDPGAQLCGHGGGLWVCFECLAKLLLGNRHTSP